MHPTYGHFLLSDPLVRKHAICIVFLYAFPLSQAFPGYFVPPLPPKKSIGKYDDDYLNDRQV